MIVKELERTAALVDSEFEKLFSSTETGIEVLTDAERYSVMSGGKRVRPFLTLEFCRLSGGTDEAALPFACAVELIHSYSLIHDDLPCMDDDDMRRGKPSCHKAFGEANALLAGDALLTYAFEVCASNKNVPASAVSEAVSLLARAAGTFGMVGGQVMDIYGDSHKLDFDTLVKLEKKKTGALICAASGLGCIAGGADIRSKLFADSQVYAENVGLTFQIIDDIIDADNGEEDEGKTTFLSFMTRDEAYAYAGRLTNAAVETVSKYEGGERLADFARFLLERRK